MMVIRKVRRFRFAAAVLLGVLLAGGFWAIPPLRSFAQEVISFFIPDEDDTQSTEIFFDTEHAEATPEMTEMPQADLQSIVDSALFEVYLPTAIPDLYALESIESINGSVFITLACNIEPWSIMITQMAFERMPDALGVSVGASAVIEPVDINGAAGEYVEGGWQVVLPENFEELRQNSENQELEVETVWDSEMPHARLAWVADGIVFEVQTGSGIMSRDGREFPCEPSLDLYAEIARGLVPASTVDLSLYD